MEPEKRIKQTRNLIPLRWTAMLPADRDEMLMLKNILQESVDDNGLQGRRNDERQRLNSVYALTHLEWRLVCQYHSEVELPRI
jgi:hypothetical protein